jgi:NhaA family Na+:H+ antiporter
MGHKYVGQRCNVRVLLHARARLYSQPRKLATLPLSIRATSKTAGFVNILQEFSIPLIAGVLAALVFANVDPNGYRDFVEFGPLDAICTNAAESGFCALPHASHLGAEHADEGEDHPAHDEGGDGVDTEDNSADEAHSDDGDGQGVADNADELEHAIGEEPIDHGTLTPVFSVFGHHATLHFIVNDIFMLFFFGIAAKEITESALPGGALNPPSKAINPLLGTLGGVLGPVAVYFGLAALLYSGADTGVRSEVFYGWGIPTATDIALAWLVARMVFGNTHPAVNFLLLLAIADDAIGLGIIAIFYGDAQGPAPIWLLLVLGGVAVSFFLRKRGTENWLPYIAIGGLLSWIGLIKASLHPALALVPIVPFLPGPKTDTGLFSADDEESSESPEEEYDTQDHSPLHNFEYDLKLFVDFGLFFFGLMNAGVAIAATGPVTWIVLGSLVIGKTVGITLFSVIGNKLGFPYPDGMGTRHMVVAGVVAGIGLTVALFVAGEAFPATSQFQGPAKMGALLSASCGVLALILGKAVGAKQLNATD